MKETISSLKRKAWKLFSEYIRRREADSNGMTFCVTCGEVYHWKELQAGHWLPGRHNSVLLDERNCHQQCMRCNIFLRGNPVRYFRIMQKRYGDKTMKQLERLDRKTKQFSVPELKKVIEGLKTKLNELNG